MMKTTEVPVAEKRNISQFYQRVRKQTEDLCKPLHPDDFIAQPIPEVSPPKWHLAHTTWLFETFILIPYLKNYQVFNEKYNYLFNSYYESIGNRVLSVDRGKIIRPLTEDVFKYRAHVDKFMSEFFQAHEELSKSQEYLLQLGINHEQQHQELLLTDIKYTYGHTPLYPVYSEKTQKPLLEPAGPFSENYINIAEGVYDIGYGGDGFCYDNEKGVHSVFLHAYQVLDRLITNEEYLEFMKNKGYQNPEYWLAEGWDWLQEQPIKAPLYWQKWDNKWHQFTLNGWRPLDTAEPITHISYYEANAFANWKGKRLLTEAEWEVACRILSPEIPEQANLAGTGIFSPLSGKNENYQFFGDCWEWVASNYLPYPFYKKQEGAAGEYNGKFMVNQMVLRGGSCITPENHIRYSYRNFFHPHIRRQYTGIRLAGHIRH